jgi:hypothetical protein
MIGVAGFIDPHAHPVTIDEIKAFVRGLISVHVGCIKP